MNPTTPKGEELRELASFLLARLDEFEMSITDEASIREFYGHISPPMARLRSALSPVGGGETASVAGDADARCSATATDTQHSAGLPGPKWIWAESADDFLRQVAGLTHCADEGYIAPDDWDESYDTINALIIRVRQIRDQPLREVLANALALSSEAPPLSPTEGSVGNPVADAPNHLPTPLPEKKT
jgi:hypothetical protein